MAKSKKTEPSTTRRVPIRRVAPKPVAETSADVTEEKPFVARSLPDRTPDADELDETEVQEMPKEHSMPKRSLRDSVLSEIYDEPEAKDEGPVGKIQRTKKQSRKWWYIIGALVVLALAAVIGFFIFSRTPRFSEKVSVRATAPTTVASGDQVSVTIAVKNDERIALRNAELTYTAPDGFTFQNSTPAPSNEFNNAWPLGTIKDNGGTSVTITGQLLGDQDTTKTFHFTLTYRPSNFNYDFQKTLDVSVTISTSVLKITPSVPLRLIPGVSTDIPVTVQNTGKDTLTNLELVADYPNGFTYTQANPKPDDKNNGWNIPKLTAGQTLSYTITGTFTGNLNDSLQFTFRGGTTSDSGFQALTQVNGIGTIVQAGMSLTTSVTNASQGASIQWGDKLNYDFTYKNDSDSDMKDVTVSVTFQQQNSAGTDVSILDLANRSDIQNGTLSSQTITWTKAQVPGLALVAAGQGGDILLRVPVLATPKVTTQADKNFVLTTNASVTVGTITDVSGSNFKTQAKPLISNVSTLLDVSPDGRYYSDQQIPVGSGPLPPQVGQATTYELSWTLTNPTNDASQIVVSTTLPDNVTWIGKQSVTAGQAVTYDAPSRTVTWRVNLVPPGTGSLFASLVAKFDVSVTPAATDVGQLIVLANKTIVTARDNFTQQDIRIERPIVTSDIPNDPSAQGKGLVVAGS